MRIALLQGGGTCPGSNDAHRGLAETAVKDGHEVVVVPFGYKGLITPDQTYQNLFDLEPLKDGAGLAGLYRRPGSVMGTSRTKPIPVDKDGHIIEGKGEEFRVNTEAIRANLEHNRIDMLAIVGGDDTLARGGRRLYEHGVLQRPWPHGHPQTVLTCGVPKTIDNDFEGMALSFGATSAGARGRSFVEEARVEANNNGKPMVVEAMGRDSGWLAAASAQHADALLIPEVQTGEWYTIEQLVPILRKTHNCAVIVVSEGFNIDGKKTFISEDLCGFGHKRLGGVRFKIVQWLEKAGVKDAMQLAPGYLFRSGPPTEEDANFAYSLGVTAMQAALRGENGKVAYLPEGSQMGDPLSLMDMSQVQGGKILAPNLYDVGNLRMLKP